MTPNVLVRWFADDGSRVLWICDRCGTLNQALVRDGEAFAKLESRVLLECEGCEGDGGDPMSAEFDLAFDILYRPQQADGTAGLLVREFDGTHSGEWPIDVPSFRNDDLAEKQKDVPTENDAVLEQTVAKFAADLADETWQKAIAARVSKTFNDRTWASISETWPAEHCSALAAVAEALDSIQEKIEKITASVVRVSLRLIGVPPFLAAVAGELAARALWRHVLEPIHDVAQLLRITGAAICAGRGCLPSCACARSLMKQLTGEVSKEVVEWWVAEIESAESGSPPDVGDLRSLSASRTTGTRHAVDDDAPVASLPAVEPVQLWPLAPDVAVLLESPSTRRTSAPGLTDDAHADRGANDFDQLA